MKNKKLISAVLLAFIIKLALLGYIIKFTPDSVIEIDSNDYITTGLTLAEHGVFARGINPNGTFYIERFRTPGYPLFLAVFHGKLKIPLSGIILIQVILSILAALITYKAACEIDQRLGLISAVIVLFDLPLTVYSLMIMTETLFVLFLSVFMYTFILYLKHRSLKLLIPASIILGLSVYIRPVNYYIAVPAAFFVLYTCLFDHFKNTGVSSSIKTGLIHAALCGLIFAGLLAPWMMRNHHHFNESHFSSIMGATVNRHSIVGSYGRPEERNKDKVSQGLPPIPYYLNVSSRCFISLMTRPGTLKYLGSDALKIASKVFGYPWMVFWLIGFIVGAAKARDNIYFHFMLLMILYYIVTSIGGTMFGVGARFRIPMVPFLAIISAHGWLVLSARFTK